MSQPLRQDRPAEIAFDQQNFLLLPPGKRSRQIGGDHALAFLRQSTSNQNFLDLPSLLQLAEFHAQVAEFFRRQTFLLGDGDQMTAAGNRQRQTDESALPWG